MPWGKSKPSRRPHPDPAKELELQRILDLRDSINRRAALIVVYRNEIHSLHRQAREDTSGKRIDQYLAQAGVLHERIGETEAAIARTGEDIAVLTAKISPDDLAFL